MTKKKTVQAGPTAEIRNMAYDALAAKSRKNKDAIISVLRKSTQPLVTSEIDAFLAMQGVSMHNTYVGRLLQQLVADGEISQREETPAERKIRFGREESRGAHFQAIYFWAPAGRVPKRTQASNLHMASRMTQTRRPATKTVKKQTGSKITTRQNLGLIARVNELENQVTELRKLLGTK